MIIKLAGNCKYYGLTEREWMAMFKKQKSACAICKQRDKKYVTDHVHVPNWKKMTPNEKKKWVRGILCLDCNRRILKHGVTLEKLKNAVTYLEEFERRIK